MINSSIGVSVEREEIRTQLKALRLLETEKLLDHILERSGKENLSYEDFLSEILTREMDSKTGKKVERLLKESHLDLRKTIESFDQKRLNQRLLGQVKNLLRGDFLKRRENVLAFGNPGSGKTHLLSGIAQDLNRKEHRVLFHTCEEWVELLLHEKANLNLSAYLKKLDKFALIFIDDIGYVQKTREEMEVLFSLLAYRYERGSVMITSNLMFSQWEQIFKDPMTTVAVVDRVVHHSVILDMNLPSYRAEEANEE
jgi:DNA replication protein DnaC